RPKLRHASRPRPVRIAPVVASGEPCGSVTPLTTSFRVPSPPTETTRGQPAPTARRARSVAWPRWVVWAASNARPRRASSAEMAGHFSAVRPPPAAGLTMTNARDTVARAWEGSDVEQERLLGGGRPPAAARARPRPFLLRLRLRLRRLRPRKLPAFLIRDAVPLFDHQQIHEARERVGQERQILFPVARRMGEGAHLVKSQGERRPVAAPGGELQVADQPGLADP